MNVQQLFLENSFEQVWSKAGKSPVYKDVYEEIYNTLIDKIPKPNDDNFTLYMTLVKEDDEFYYHISGKHLNDEQAYSISMTDWDEIAGFEVELGDFPVETFIMELLHEISFYGLEEDMKRQRDELIRRVEEIENGSARLIPARDLLKSLDEDNEDFDELITESEREQAKQFMEAAEYLKNQHNN